MRPQLRDYLRRGLRDSAVDLVFPADREPAALLPLVGDAAALVGWRPTAELLAAARSLRLFINPGAGVQGIVHLFSELNAGREFPVVLVNGHGNACFTAQHTVALLLALTNRIVPHHNWLAAGRWRTGDAEAASLPLRGRRLALLGYGHVNRRVHRLLAGFPLEFAALRRAPWTAPQDPPTPLRRCGTAELDELLDWADILVCCLPETPATRGLIGRDELARLGRRGLLVNVGRGPVVDEDALYEALDQGLIAGAALDVWYDYRPAADSAGRRHPWHRPFHELDNVVLSPHRAASPFDDLGRWDEVVENLRRLAAGRDDFLNVVDLELGY